MQAYRKLTKYLVWMACLVGLYILPSLVAWRVAHSGSWIAVILMGDLAGCLAIGFLVGWWRFAALLYFGLAIIEATVYFQHAITLTELAWITDVVPTCIFAYLLVNLLESMPIRHGGGRDSSGAEWRENPRPTRRRATTD